MFRCRNCGKFTEGGQPANKVVSKRRRVKYQNMVPKRRGRPLTRKDKKKKRKIELIPKESTGWEIVEEVNVCPKCYTTLTGKKPVVKLSPIVPEKKNEISEPKLRKPIYSKEAKKKKQPEVEVVVSLPILTD